MDFKVEQQFISLDQIYGEEKKEFDHFSIWSKENS